MNPLPRSRFSGPWPALGTAALLAASLAIGSLLVLPNLVQGRTDAVQRTVTPRGALGADELANVELFRRTSPSVVHITTLQTQRDLFSRSVQQVPRGTGTGFV